MKSIAIFTMYWGPVYSKMFKDYQLPSFMQDGNLPRLSREGYDIKWHVYADQQPPENPFIVYHHTDEKVTVPCLRDFINSNMGTMCFMIYPDNFVGNHSMYNGVKMVENKPNMCLSVAHPRVSLEKINGMPITAKNNAQLVSFAFEYAHKCLWGACDNLDTNMTWAGISWRQIDEKNYAVIHNLATPWIFQFQPSDTEFICTTHNGCLDRGFIAKMLSEGRIKICGSSDLCFFVELTTDAHNQHLRGGMRFNDLPTHDGHGNDETINAHWNNVIVNWRKE